MLSTLMRSTCASLAGYKIWQSTIQLFTDYGQFYYILIIDNRVNECRFSLLAYKLTGNGNCNLKIKEHQTALFSICLKQHLPQVGCSPEAVEGVPALEVVLHYVIAAPFARENSPSRGARVACVPLSRTLEQPSLLSRSRDLARSSAAARVQILLRVVRSNHFRARSPMS